MRINDNSSRFSAISDNGCRNSSAHAGVLLGGLGVLAFSFSLPANKLAVAGIDAVGVTVWRAALAGLLALAYLRIVGAQRPALHDLAALLCSGLGVVVGFPLFSSLALERIDSATGAVILGLLPAMTATFAALLGGERLPWLFWAATGAGVLVLCAFLVSTSPDALSGFALSWGHLWMVLATVSAGFGYAVGGTQAKRIGGAQSISWSLVLLLPISVPLCALTAATGSFSLTGPVVIGMIYITVISQFLGFFAWYGGLARGGIARVGQIQQVQPLLTIAWSALLLGEHLDRWIYPVGVVLGLLVWIAQRARFREAARAVPPVPAPVAPDVNEPVSLRR
ncbi:DMT family transporter [Williamsia muralis]|uniref:DMT family transporter n=1 Tax=Williamsia marianensis TaxID=85044 RepID=UPI00381B0BB7